ncbi:replication factor A protein 3 [Colletotrichum musicola]|uniref:Replication factor A protein 3 n=1 Tax=Colletotrichum musicola TaxID=2175873 RepID=A0A8H6NYV6_9PEZI|nr:replication factor A protein 3 [Colletotrichum musicola]
MAESTSTPRITAQYLDNYVGRNVILIGKVLQLRGDSAVLDADGNVTALLNRDVHLTNGNGAQIIGKVNPDLTIKVLTSRDLGPGVDYQLAAAVSPSPRKNPPRDLVIRPATAPQQQQQQQQQNKPRRESRYYEPPTPTLPSPELSRSESPPRLPTHPPSSQTPRRLSPTTPPSQPPSSHSPHLPSRQYNDQHVNANQRTTIPHRPSRSAAPPFTPPSSETPRQRMAPGATTNPESSTQDHTHRERKHGRERSHRWQKSRANRTDAGDLEVTDDSELLGAILDGIGRMTVGTVAMRMDEGGRWRIRRDSGNDDAQLPY